MEPGVEASPSINSVLKPPRPRIPLKELMSAVHEEDNTAARKRRVSFANVNKIKEFSAGAESMVVCHTPAYEEPFYVSSDSSCPSGVDGWTPAKSDPCSGLADCSTVHKENGSTEPMLAGFDQLESLGMDLTYTNRQSLRFSVGMDLTEVVRPCMNESGESMDVTKMTSQLYQQYQSGDMSPNVSCEIEFTEAVIDPRFSLPSSRYSVSNTDFTKHVHLENNTRYSVNAMDLTKAAISPYSGGRRSSQYSLSSMELTEVVGNDLELTEVIRDPKILTTDMELTEALTRESSMELTKPVFTLNQSRVSAASRPSMCYSADMDSLELSESESVTEDTPTTQTLNGTQSVVINPDLKDKVETQTEDNTCEEHVVSRKEIENEPQPSVEQLDSSTGGKCEKVQVQCVTFDKAQQEDCNFVKEENDISINVGGIEYHLNESNYSKNKNALKTDFHNNECLNKVDSAEYSVKRSMAYFDIQPDIQINAISKTKYDFLEKGQAASVKDESIDSPDPPALSVEREGRKSFYPGVLQEMTTNESDMEISMLSPGKHKKSPALNESLEQVQTCMDIADDVPSQTVPKLMLNDEEMDVSLSESHLMEEIDDSIEFKSQHSNINTCKENIKEDNIDNQCLDITTNIDENEKVIVELKEDECEYKGHDLGETSTHTEESVNLKDISNTAHLADSVTDVSTTNNIVCDRNITMTRGGRVSTDSTLDSSNDELIRADQPSELDSSLPLIQRMEKLQKTADFFDIHSNKPHDGDLLCRKEKGGKRSFEVALEAENDTEESPVKQICLPNSIHQPDTAPSLLMDKLSFHHETVASLHQSDIRAQSEDLHHSTNKSVCEEGNSSSLNVDISTNNKEPSLQNEPSVICPQPRAINHSSVDIYRQTVQHSKHQNNHHQHNLISSTTSKTCDSKLNQFPITPAARLQFRKERTVIKLRDNVYTYNLIPRWIEQQFSTKADGSIYNTTYTIICSDKERAIGEYLLKQVTALPEVSSNLTTLSQAPRDPFILHLAKMVSHICKYYNGTLVGHMLTLEVICMRQEFWTFIDVNIKYPKYISAEDVTISEQRVGELKLSTVRQIFNSVEKQDNHLLNFAAALKDLQY